MQSEILEASDSRFAISDEGWRRMNAGRKAAHLIREAISNTFDLDDVTSIKVYLKPGHVSIEDDSVSGIADPSLVTTVFMTDKEDDPTKRGRKGRGLKELLAAAEHATVDTVGFKVEFSAGRKVYKSDRTRGTLVSLSVPEWTQEDIDQSIVYFEQFIPPANIQFVVNGRKIASRRLRSTISRQTLMTHIVRNGVQVESERETDVEIYNLAKGETQGWIYEMGIPVQHITCKFHINIKQRVPMNDNRDAVDWYWLAKLYGTVLEHMLPSMSARALRYEWANQGLQFLRTVDTKRMVVKKLYGDYKGIAIKSSNSRANDLAKTNGFELINHNDVTYELRNIINDVVPSVQAIVQTLEENQTDTIVHGFDQDRKLTSVVQFLGRRLINREVKVVFIERPPRVNGNIVLAHWDDETSTVSFNLKSGVDFTNPLSARVLSIIVHEFAHTASLEHDQVHSDEMEKLAGHMAEVVLLHAEEIKHMTSGAVANKTVKILCEDCGAERWIKPQDVHQVKKCETHTKLAKKERAKLRRIGKL